MLLAGPYWFLQLWLNATFEPSLSTSGTVNNEEPEIKNRTVKGTRLLRLTPEDDGKEFENNFIKYVMMFSKCHVFSTSMVPFANMIHGPEWFTRSLFDISPEYTYIIDI